MKVLNIDGVQQTPAQQQETQDLKQQLHDDPVVAKKFKENHIDERYYETSPWKIAQWRKDYEPCMHCTGLNQCKQRINGYYDDLCDNGILQLVQTPCRYKQNYMNQTSHIEKYLSNDLPKQMFTVSFDKINLSKETEEYLLVWELCRNASLHNQGLYLYGTMGCGKTYLSACGANDHARKGEKTAYIHYPTYCTRAISLMKTGEYKTELSRLMRAKFLVIDDIGAESVNEWNRDQLLLPLLEKRYTEGLTTWFTSNCDIDTLKEHFRYVGKGKEDELKAARIMERITSMAKIQTLTGKDRRKTL
ncbi:MAG: ATP-binding protein [Erysipelotrichaceae bacterium]|nr:ATP-binding protein [Erysipelotrichaceae bacterium]MDY6034637.1 ATP-binding protein [Bulleidia sp.]